MSGVSRRAAARLLRPSRTHLIRPFSTPSNPSSSSPPPQPPAPTGPSYTRTKSKEPLSPVPYTISQPPQFPPPNDPFDQHDTPAVPSSKAGTDPAASAVPAGRDASGQEYSDTTKAVVRGVARLMGYNSKASTAIRETGRMMRGIVECVERDRLFWYDQCGLPPTYQTFFQLHLLYVLILLPRLRALPPDSTPSNQPIPEPLDPSPPHHPSPSVDTIITSTSASSSPSETSTSSPSVTSSSSSTPILSKPDYESYPSELLNHFFNLAESEMRKVLGRGERERVVKKYMEEMGEQWKGAGVGMDYVLGLSGSDSPEDLAKADVELASWVWRNLFGSRGLNAGPPMPPVPGVEEVEGMMMERLEDVVVFVRKELKRLDAIEDGDILAGNIGQWSQAESSS